MDNTHCKLTLRLTLSDHKGPNFETSILAQQKKNHRIDMLWLNFIVRLEMSQIYFYFRELSKVNASKSIEITWELHKPPTFVLLCTCESLYT